MGGGPVETKPQPGPGAPAAKPLATNVLMLLTPKENVAYLQGDNTLRQAWNGCGPMDIRRCRCWRRTAAI